MTSAAPVKVTRDGVTMTVASQQVADNLVTAHWQPVKTAKPKKDK